ncbi:MAG TPA: DUF4162 domain-containing protein, partial [Ilumatobacteraceae bacterium]|nr:DUF4162 domain-containing protein [Ilumatobacteraceae bacterium]
VIIDRGHVVLAGDLDEVRAAVASRFVDIRFRGVAPDWTTLTDLVLVESTDGHVRLRLDSEVDLEAVLAFARRTTDVVSFSFQPPTLSELFRQTVAS